MNIWLVGNAIEAVCRTYESNPKESAALLRRIIERSALEEWGAYILPRLTNEIKRLISLDVDFVSDVYLAAFGHQEESEEPTALGGNILSFRSTKGQDYGMALYELAEAFPAFLRNSPDRATQVLLNILEGYASTNHAATAAEEATEEFTFLGATVRFRLDYSCIWDSGDAYAHNEPIRMLNFWTEYIRGISDGEGNPLPLILATVAAKSSLAVVWRRLLMCGASAPATVGTAIKELLWTPLILTSPDTYHPAGECLARTFPVLQPEDRERIEHTILSLSAAAETDESYSGRNRDRLLSCLPEEAIVLDATREAIARLASGDGKIANEPPFSLEYEEGIWSDTELLTRRGVQISQPENQRLLTLAAPLKGFAAQAGSGAPTKEAFHEALPAIRAMADALHNLADAEVHEAQETHAWSCLAGACAFAAHLESQYIDELSYRMLVEILLKSAARPEPHPNNQQEAQFAHSPFWSDMDTRVAAAEGLTLLARFGVDGHEDVQGAVLRLSADPVPSVRFQVASNLASLADAATAFAWAIAQARSQEEPNAAVAGALAVSIHFMLKTHPDRAFELARLLHDRFQLDEKATQVRNYCINTLTNLTVEIDHYNSRTVLHWFASDISRFHEEIAHCIVYLRRALTLGPINPPDAYADAIRTRAVGLVMHVVGSVYADMERILSSNGVKPQNQWAKEELDTFQKAVQSLDAFGMQVYFASGAFQAEREDMEALDPDKKRRFLVEIGPLIDLLVETGIPRLSYHLIQMFAVYADLEPKIIFLKLRRTVAKAAQRGNLEYESIAADAVVKIIT